MSLALLCSVHPMNELPLKSRAAENVSEKEDGVAVNPCNMPKHRCTYIVAFVAARFVFASAPAKVFTRKVAC